MPDHISVASQAFAAEWTRVVSVVVVILDVVGITIALAQIIFGRVRMAELASDFILAALLNVAWLFVRQA